MRRVIVVGSSNTDMSIALPRLPETGQTVLGGRFITSPGGKGANQAVAARRAGAEVVLVSAVGNDTLGREAIAHYDALGIDTSFIKIIDGSASGVALILVDNHGENMIGVAPGANSQLTPDDIDRLPETLFSPDNLLLVSLEIPIATARQALSRARGHGLTTILNPAPAPPLSDSNVRESLALASIITPNRIEAQALSGLQLELDMQPDWTQCARELKTMGPEIVVITMGASGCLAFKDHIERIPAPSVNAIDTVGAGDAFNGALAAAMLENKMPLAHYLTWANAAAALAVTQRGAQSSSPTRDAIDRLVATATTI